MPEKDDELQQASNKKESRPKLVLHFDIRNTMIVADTVTSITVEQALNAYLTGVLWGREVGRNQWEWASHAPTLQPPTKDSTTFYKHLEKLMVREPVDRVALRLAVGDFVHTEMGMAFKDYYTKHLRLLEWHHEHIDSPMTLKGKNGKNYHYILPAVYRLIQHLHDTGRDFSLIIRTYGLDCGNVLNSVSHTISTGEHPQFPHLPDLKLNPDPGKILRDANRIRLQAVEGEGQSVSVDMDEESKMYEYLNQVEGVCGFKDDFLYWQDNNYHHKCAKPMWIDPGDKNHRHIFFDDNYRLNTVDSIVDVRERDSRGKWTSVDDKQLAKHDGMSLVQVDLLEAIANENYFIDKIIECERKYDIRDGHATGNHVTACGHVTNTDG